MLLSKDNHLQIKRKAKQNADAFCHITGVVKRPVGSFRSECIRAAREISKVYENQEIFVFLSGGMDSEVVAESFRLAKVKFTPLILKYEDGLNQPDIQMALAWCKKRSIEPRIVPFHLRRFFSSPWPIRIAKKYKYTKQVYLILMKAYSRLPKESVGILGSGEPLLVRNRKVNCLEEPDDELSLFRFAMDIERPFITHFFFWSPELYLAFITSPEYFDFLRQRGEVYKRSFPLKEKLFRREFKLKDRPKRHGLEAAHRRYTKLIDRFEKFSTPTGKMIPYAREIRYLMSDMDQKVRNET